MRTVIPGAQAASGRPFSGATIANGWVFVSGQTMVEGADIEAQTHGVLDKISELLMEAGSDLSHVMQCMVFMSDLRLYGRMNDAYAQHFPNEPPARFVVGADLGSKECLIEIACTAIAPD